jgi:hypothetical protein
VFDLTDYDGRRPDWGAHAIDFSMFPKPFLDQFRTMTELRVQRARDCPSAFRIA